MAALNLNSALSHRCLTSAVVKHSLKRVPWRALTTKEVMSREDKYGAKNYAPVPVAVHKALGPFLWDVEGKRYYDFLSAYSAVNQGHSHPRIVKALTEQAQVCALTSRAFYNSVLGECEQFMTELFGYERVLMMNSGVEACESAVKLARRWAYDVKGVRENEAVMIFANDNFWGRSIAAISASTDPESFSGYGPFVPNFDIVPYNNVDKLEQKLASCADKAAAVMLEPIQGEAGVIVPSDDYFARVRELCDKYNALLIADEVQTGLGRTAPRRRVCMEHYGVRPDLVVLGKALSGGLYPVSAVLADDPVMLTIKPGQHGSTYGGNPLACSVAMAALKVLEEEKLSERAAKLGAVFMKELSNMNDKVITNVRGKGLMVGITISKQFDAWDMVLRLKENGLVTKNTHGDKIRLAPPLVITDEQLSEAVGIIKKTVDQMAEKK